MRYIHIPVMQSSYRLPRKFHYDTTFEEFGNTIRVSNPPVLDSKPEKNTNGAIYAYGILSPDSIDIQNTLKAVNDVKYTALTHSGAEVTLWKTGDNYQLGRCDNIVEEHTMFKMDVDEQDSPDTYNRVKRILDEMGVSYIMYTSSSNATVKNCKVYDPNGLKLKENNKDVVAPRLAYGFRIYIPYAAPIPNNHLYKSIRDLMYEDMRIRLGFDVVGVNRYDKIASTNVSQLMVPPYKLKGFESNYQFTTKYSGVELDWTQYVEQATANYEAQVKLDEAKKTKISVRVEKIKKFKADSSTFRRKLNYSGTGFVADFDGFVERLSEELTLFPYTYNGTAGYTCECPAEHDTNNDRKLMILPTETGGVLTKCFGTDCKYNHSSAFLSDYQHCIPDAVDIDQYVEVTKINEQSQFKTLIDTVSNSIPPLNTPTNIIAKAAPGLGKTATTCILINNHLADTNDLPIHATPILLILVPTHALQADLERTYESIFGENFSGDSRVSVLNSGHQIKKNAVVIISVQTYAAKMGHTMLDYKLIKYLKKDWPVDGDDSSTVKRKILLIIDEADTYISSLQKTINVGFRVTPVHDDTKLSSMQDFDIFRKECPTSKTCSYQCDRCQYRSHVEIVPNSVDILELRPCVTTKEIRLMKMKHGELLHIMDPHEENVEFGRYFDNVSLSERGDLSIAYDNKAHICTSYDIVPNDPDTEAIRFSDYVAKDCYMPEIIRINDHVKYSTYVESYFEYEKKCVVPDDVSDEEQYKRKSWYSQIYEPTLSKFFENENYDEGYNYMLPYHPCSATFLRYYDTSILNYIIKQSDYVLCLSATYDKTNLDIYNHLMSYNKMGEPTLINITPATEMKPIDNLLVMVTKSEINVNDLDIVELDTELRNYVDEASPSNSQYRDEIGLHMHVDKSKGIHLEYQKLDRIIEYHAWLGGIGTTVSSEAKTYKPSLVRTYAGSPFTRGANLGEFHSITYNFFQSYDLPMYALKTYNGDTVQYLRESHKVSGMIQALFRIMRKKKDPMTLQITQHPSGIERRVMMIGGATNVIINEKSSNSVIDYTKDIASIVKGYADDVSKEVTTLVIDDERFLNSSRLLDAMFKMRHHYLRTGEIKMIDEEFDERIFANNNRWIELPRILSKYPNILKITGMTLEELKENRAYIIALNKITDRTRRDNLERIREKYADFKLKMPLSEEMMKKHKILWFI